MMHSDNDKKFSQKSPMVSAATDGDVRKDQINFLKGPATRWKWVFVNVLDPWMGFLYYLRFFFSQRAIFSLPHDWVERIR